jgi:hypothetical protein
MCYNALKLLFGEVVTLPELFKIGLFSALVGSFWIGLLLQPN